MDECRYFTSAKVDHREIGKTGVRPPIGPLASSDGRAYIAALEACEGVDDGLVSDESARELFLLALKEAENPYSTDIER
ncbi:DUF982 domain-containing protein [Rhizobium leguminosarum]